MTVIESVRAAHWNNPAAEPATSEELTAIVIQKISKKPLPTEVDLSWRINASCRDTNPELFFPVGSKGRATRQIEQAQQVCLTCTAREACLEYALVTNQDSGVWGATSEQDRRDIRRKYLR